MACQLRIKHLMKIMLITHDQQISRMFESEEINFIDKLTILKDNSDPLEIMSSVCEDNPSILILDDDFVNPHSGQILRSIKKVNPNINIIFITSDTSIELGREISPLGIQFYAHKPIKDTELLASIESISRMKMQKH
jgi:DNA-binding NarL/FixJ family response regulator